MGGDDAPAVVIRGAEMAARSGVPVVLVGDQEVLPQSPLVPVIHAPDRVEMSEAASVVRRRSEASMRVALRAVAQGRCGAMVSCGHSGALLVASMMELGVIPGAERPAIATSLPRGDGGRLLLVDAGANVDCRPELLAAFALMGSAYAETTGVLAPRVALLSNGHEPSKGNAQVRAALPSLSSLPVRFVGPMEPTDALAGGCDVIVCDGFVGNVLLKSAEGAAAVAVALLREEILRNMSGRFGAWLLRGAFRRFRERVAWDAHGGGVLLGVEGVVVVGHGRATAGSVAAAIRMAHAAVVAGRVPALRRRLAPRVVGG